MTDPDFFDVALDLLKRHSGIVWDPRRVGGIAPRGPPCAGHDMRLTHNGRLLLVHVGIETLVLEVAIVVARNMGGDPVRLQL